MTKIYPSTLAILLLSLAFAGCPGSCGSRCGNSCAAMAHGRFIDSHMRSYQWGYDLDDISTAIVAEAVERCESTNSAPANTAPMVIGEPWVFCPESQDRWLSVTVTRGLSRFRLEFREGWNRSSDDATDEGDFDGELALEVLERVDPPAAAEVRAEAERRAERARGCGQRACGWVDPSPAPMTDEAVEANPSESPTGADDELSPEPAQSESDEAGGNVSDALDGSGHPSTSND